MTIVDVTVPYDNEEAFERARQVKRTKYQPIAEWLKDTSHTDAHIEAIIVRSLSSWDPENENVLGRFHNGTK